MTLTLSFIMLNNGQIYFKILAAWIPQDFWSMSGHFSTWMKGLTAKATIWFAWWDVLSKVQYVGKVKTQHPLTLGQLAIDQMNVISTKTLLAQKRQTSNG